MRRFDYSFLQKNISGDLFGLANVISGLNAKVQLEKKTEPAVFENLRKKAVVASVRGSNAIEGIVTTEDRLMAIVSGGKGQSHDEKEISGYRDALNYIHANCDSADFSAEIILLLHKLIESDTNPAEAGKLKSRDNLIMEYHDDGTRKIRFRPVPAAETPAALEQLVLAYIDARQNSSIPSILLIPCVILDFLCIHPFTDGNGRVSRLLTLLLMYISGYDVGRYISVEEQIDLNREAYYEALQKSSSGWNEGNNDYNPFIIFHLQIVYRCFKKLDESFSGTFVKAGTGREKVRKLLENAFVPVSKAEILERLPGVGVKTAEAVLAEMLSENKIIKIGTYRNARYVRK